ncbi:hypothetical protein C5167_047303 [Papaver somniferum]|uniref:Uncharacterized protein n=1 Tax=Papaver somniferum TaxID=3469 RepID=A0A4Y7LHQ8_PAPSO|nr:uncharacterized protein LOC113321035 [Papaver somniferum]RZC84517.1 hypothetical protein C5167_047303 [Papaver somniferum]
MTMSFNSVATGFNSSKLQVKHWTLARPYGGGSTSKTEYVTASSGLCFGSRKGIKYGRFGFILSASSSNQVAADTADKGSSGSEKDVANEQLLAASSLAENIQLKSSPKAEQGLQTTGSSNGSPVTTDEAKETTPSAKSPKRSSLTAREKLRAARVLSRNNTDSKPPSKKSVLGSKVLDALRESDRESGKKRMGLPEAPSNMLDDSRRGMPKQGLTWDLPGGNELFFIIFSATFIGTLMFATAFVVWKVGAIHFND